MSKFDFRRTLFASTALIACSLSSAAAFANGYDTLYVSAPPPGLSETLSATETFYAAYIGIADGESGTLTIAPGVTMTTLGLVGFISDPYGGIIGQDQGSTGTVIISGTGSTWTDESDYVIVGQSGTGTLQLSSGGTLNTNNVTIGEYETGNGTVTIDGVGTTWDNLYTTNIGPRGTGSVTVSGGAVVTNGETLNIGGRGFLSRAPAPLSGTGSLTVTGTGTTWYNTGGVNVGRGDESTGSLTVENGASFQTYDGSIYAGLGATITVTGPGTTMLLGTRNTTPPVDWDAAAGYFSPDDGATSVISNGATLNADATYIGGAGTAAVTTLTVTGAGTTWHNWLNIYVGGTGNGDGGYGAATVSDGAVATAYTAGVGVDAGSVGTLLLTGQGTLFQVLSRDGFSGNFRVGYEGNGTVTVQNGATLTAANLVHIANEVGSVGVLNIGAAEGEAPVAPGTVLGTNGVFFGSGDATLVFNHTSTGLTFNNELSGTGGAIRHLAGVTNFTVDSPDFEGTLDVIGGTVKLNASIPDLAVTVGAGGTLGGNTTIASLSVEAGGTVTPGNSIGTLVVTGDVTFAPGSIYVVELDGAGNSDLITASGQAFLNGATVNLVALDPQASYKSAQVYTIVAATGGVVGAFGAVTTDSLFLTVDVNDLANGINVVISASDNAFTSVAVTPNQIATSAALGTLPQTGASLALYNSVLFLTSASEAQWAYDQLSGEVHASTQSLFMEQSSLIRGALNDRLRAAQGGVGASAGTVVNVVETSSGALAYAAPSPVKVAADLSIPVKAAPAVAPVERFALWSTAFGNWGDMDGNSNAAGVSDSTGGFLIGADTLVGDGWRLGVAGGYSYTDFSISGRNSSGSSDNWHIGLYGGNEWGPLALRTGLAYTWQDISTNRSVAFTGYTDSLSADYDAGTVQAFGELGYRIDAAGIAFEPFANLSYVSLHQDGYREEGGAAALTGDSQTMDTTFTTLGVRLAKEIAFGSTAATLRGALGWRHAFGDIDPTVTQAFAGSDAFTVTGAPIAEDAAVVEAGLDVLISATATLGIAYTGQYGDGVSENGFNARLSVRF
ncbi:autotransporter domain-containing protein [Ancylobacter sp. WKF20]|uniref:autotransporter domain-containing protein n=1 Tax=Ancylobacter sp. WKF20 TaxID=3039801 RepID=UPI0024344BD5|nr:autotransporter domain-containing protein [Ancylobacter sp. WKF20]WGD28864.1 autotransporter domain-containing protein [Ancylobacter sp. WKF20]